MSLAVQTATIPAPFGSNHGETTSDTTQAPQTDYTPAFSVEPPTPTARTQFSQHASKEAQEDTSSEAVDVLFGGRTNRSPSEYSGNSLRASPLAYSRHHPYATSVSSSYDDISSRADSYDGGPVRSRRTHSLASRSSYESGDGDYYPDEAQGDDEDYMEDMDHHAYLPASKPSRMAKEPVRLTATGKPSHARRLPEGHIKRPRNAFILFRSHACVNQLVPASLGITDHRHISRIVGQMWKNLPAVERKVWEDQAEAEKEEHRRAHPEYKYRPVYRREGVVRRRRRKAQDEKDVEEEERKCEVVARVLLEGGDISEDRVEKEIEMQRERDSVEGRLRGPAARAATRSVSSSRRNQMPIQPTFDMNYGMVQYGSSLFEPYGNNGRRSQPIRATSLNVRYDGDGNEEDVVPEEGAHLEAAYMQRSQTMPPLHYDEADYYGNAHHFAYNDSRTSRAAPPQPLNLYRHGDASLAPLPISPGILFGAEGHGYPVTPRTCSMQQHQLALQQRLRGGAGTLLSPRNAEFGLQPIRRSEGATREPLVSPMRTFSHESSLGFDHGFLEGALNSEIAAQHDGALNSAADQQLSTVAVDEPGTVDKHTDGQHSRYHIDGNDAFLIPGRPNNEGTRPAGQAMGDYPKTQGAEDQQEGYSALGEMAAGSGGGPETPVQGISFQPDGNVAYVFLDAKQAQDQVLVDSIRAQGFGITLDASEQQLANLAATTLATR